MAVPPDIATFAIGFDHRDRSPIHTLWDEAFEAELCSCSQVANYAVVKGDLAAVEIELDHPQNAAATVPLASRRPLNQALRQWGWLGGLLWPSPSARLRVRRPPRLPLEQPAAVLGRGVLGAGIVCAALGRNRFVHPLLSGFAC